MATVQGGPGDEADAGCGAVLVHLALFLAVAERVVVLHGDEGGPVVGACGGLELGELEGPH